MHAKPHWLNRGGTMGLRASADRRTPLVLMTMAAFWLASHPWIGIRHDNVLYAAQALRRLYPLNFHHDLYFLFGSQDTFTVFSPIYAASISALGLLGATLSLLIAGYALWIAATCYLLSSLLRGFYFWLGLAMLFIWPADYGPLPRMFSLAEGFLTPRLFAEGLGILSLACLVREQWKWGMLALLLSLALHPLMAEAPLLASAFLLARRSWRAAIVLGALGSVILAAGATLGISPFDRLLMNMDPEWYALVNKRAPMVTWTAWQSQDWLSRTAVAFCLLLTAGQLAKGAASGLFRSAAGVGALGLLASWLGTGLYHDLLLIQIQPWRMLWLTQLCSWIALAWLIAEYWNRGRLLRYLLLCLCMAALTRNSIGGAVALLSAAALGYYANRPVLPWPKWANGAALAGMAGLAGAWLLEVTWSTRADMAYFADQGLQSPSDLWLFTAVERGAYAAAGTLLLIAVWRWGASGQARLHLAAFAISCGCFSLALAVTWFAAQSQALSSDGKRAVQATFLPLIPPSATIYWQDNLALSWNELHRSSYASDIQLAGIAFNRGTAIEGARRMDRILRLGGEDALMAPFDKQIKGRAKTEPASANPAALRFVCDDPLLDFVILAAPLGSAAVAQARDTEYGKTYYLYECARLRGR